MKDSIKQLKKDLKVQLRAVALIQSAIAKLSGAKTRKRRKAKAEKAVEAEEPKKEARKRGRPAKTEQAVAVAA